MKQLLIIAAILIHAPLMAQERENHPSQVIRNLEIFSEIYKNLDLYYVDTLAADTAIEWAINGMLSRVDPYTTYYPADDEDLRQMATGKYAGIGSIIRFHKGHDRVVISEPYQGTPSDKAGLKSGDIILSIDGKDIKGMTPTRVTTMLRGDAGTTFQLRFQRPGEAKPRTVSITRQTIQLPSVPYSSIMNDSIGYIALTGFTEGTAREVRGALSQLMSQGATSLILDLRENPGGSLSEAVDIANLFLPKGQKIVYTKGKQPSTNREYYTTTDPICPDLPLAVLVNQGSASASEIVSGSLQDMDRAVIIGTRTYGKGLIQAIRDLPYRGELKITTSRYYIPSGRCIQAHQYNHDGSIKTLPDSLQKEFRTANGRTVRDGGGIKPDIHSEPDTLATMIYDLVQSDQFFDWLNTYTSQATDIPQPGYITVSDSTYDHFCHYIKEHDFQYNRRTDEVIKLLREVARREGYLDIASDELQALEDKVKPDLAADLVRHKDDILPIIADEIATRRYYQQGAIRQQLTTDTVFHQAVQILQDPLRYRQILTP